jgi:hypothetical protein
MDQTEDSGQSRSWDADGEVLKALKTTLYMTLQGTVSSMGALHDVMHVPVCKLQQRNSVRLLRVTAEPARPLHLRTTPCVYLPAPKQLRCAMICFFKPGAELLIALA